MRLTENYKNRLKNLAGVNMLNEDMHPQFMDFGFYDMANGMPETLLERLSESGVKYSYDPYRNYVIIETDNPREVLPMLYEAEVDKLSLEDQIRYFDDPNDCVLVKAATAPNPPPGAMM